MEGWNMTREEEVEAESLKFQECSLPTALSAERAV
jgi:hypothetical protein